MRRCNMPEPCGKIKEPANLRALFTLRRQFLENLEVDLDVQFNQDRLTVLHRGFEPVLPHGLQRLLVQAHSYGANYPHMAGKSIGLDPQSDEHIAGKLSLASLLGELRFNLIDDLRRRDSAADSSWSATRVAARTGSKSGSIARAEAGA